MSAKRHGLGSGAHPSLTEAPSRKRFGAAHARAMDDAHESERARRHYPWRHEEQCAYCLAGSSRPLPGGCEAEGLRGNAARAGRSAHAAPTQAPGEDGLAARMFLVRSGRRLFNDRRCRMCAEGQRGFVLSGMSVSARVHLGRVFETPWGRCPRSRRWRRRAPCGLSAGADILPPGSRGTIGEARVRWR
jgi:hypothetical protein